MKPAAVIDENLRRVSARVTKQIALRFGQSLPMWIGCGYPKSGTVWLCQLMASYLGVPYPKDYRSPIAMESVIHSHWRHDSRLPPTAYIVRDGRDVMVSFYFFHMRALTLTQKPVRKRRLSSLYRREFGENFDPADTERNLPRFIELAFERGWGTRGVAWDRHVHEWIQHEGAGVGIVTYEDLLADTAGSLAKVMATITEMEPSIDRAKLAADRFEFSRTSGRIAGEEGRSEFQRKGIAGDWQNHFTAESAEIFDHFAGDTLVALGYATDRSWHKKVRS